MLIQAILGQKDELNKDLEADSRQARILNEISDDTCYFVVNTDSTAHFEQDIKFHPTLADF